MKAGLALADRADAVFAADLAATPAMTLRGGDAVDGYDLPPPYDPETDVPTGEYLERHARGLGYLDASSWRHYLPRMIRHALPHAAEGPESLDHLLWALRPPDRDPPRLGSLTPAQEAVVVEFLEVLAMDDRCPCQELALQVLEEYWIPGALYRTPAGGRP